MHRSSFAKFSLIFALGWIGGLVTSLATEPNWPVIGFTQVIQGVRETVDIQNAADGSGRLFLVRQNGKIQMIKNGALLPVPLLDVGDRIRNGGEQGLLGLAFPPNFTVAKCFYIYYCRWGDGATVLSRFRMGSNPNAALADSEEILLVTPKPESDHNGGQLAFGPDGFLYLSIGDGGGSGDPQRNSQNLTNNLGKILRIDVNNTNSGLPYAIPVSNPFATSATYSREIVCWGLRNPWRFSFDSLTGDLFIGDVGEQQREEINFIPAAAINAGTNLGWSVKEGTLDYTAQAGTVGTLQPPAFEYNHPLGYSVTGGHIYRGSNPRLHGFYLFGDYVTGRIWAMESPAAGGRVAVLKDTAYNISTFGKDEAGEIYFADYRGGSVYRIDALDILPAPVVSPAAGVYTSKVSFTMSTDVPGAVVRYTTDGSAPDATSPVFTPGSSVEKREPFHLRTAAFRPDMNPSPIVDRLYKLRPESVQIGTGTTSFNDYTTIQLTSPTPAAEIRYTTDGSTPTATSQRYSPGDRISINRNMTVRAIAIRAAAGWQPSLVAARQYYLTVSEPRLADPYLDLYDLVNLTSDTPGVSFFYRIIGGNDSSLAPWPGPHELAANSLILVSAEKEGMTSSIAHLTVRRISAQGARFEKLPGNPGNWVADLVRVNGSKFYAIDSDTLWKLQDGIWTNIYQHNGSPYRFFTAVAIAADGRIAIAYRGNPAGILMLTAAGTQVEEWNLGDASPMDLLALPTGGFLLADHQGNQILKVTGPSSVTALPAYEIFGGPGSTPVQADLERPPGIARDDAGNFYYPGHNRLRRLDTSNMVTTLAGSGGTGWTDGPSLSARLERPVSLARDRLGNFYVAEERSSSDAKIRKIMPDGHVVSLRGSLFEAGSITPASTVSFGVRDPQGMVVDENGALYVAGDYTITRIIQEDWDNDGIPDTTETALGAPFVVGVDDRFADSDGDQLSNLAEWIAGTNPGIVTNSTALTVIKRKADGTFALQFPCEPGGMHQLEYSDDLQNWKPMGVPWSSPFRSFTARFTAPTLSSQRYYRLRSTL